MKIRFPDAKTLFNLPLLFVSFASVDLLFSLNRPAHGQITAATVTGSAKLYLDAAKIISGSYSLNIMSPSASDMVYPEYPPYSTEWMTREKAAFDANVKARDLAHAACSIDKTNWPTRAQIDADPNLRYFNSCRSLANELADASIYQHLQGKDATAIQTLRDLFHLADAVKDPTQKTIISLLVSVGIQELAIQRLMIIASNVALTDDVRDISKLQKLTARDLISRMLIPADNKAELDDYLKADGGHGKPMPETEIDALTRVVNSINAESKMAAVSLACQLFRSGTGHWPATLLDLKPYLPALPTDPFSNDKSPLGYTLIKAGLPDGSDRPMVYSNFGSSAKLFFRTNEPAYSYYDYRDGDADRMKNPPQGGQFRDIANWAPRSPAHNPSTTRPID